MNKKIAGITTGVVLLLVLTVSIIWIAAYNKVTTLSNEIPQKEAEIYNAYGSRYEKVAGMIDAIESANQQIIDQMALIMDARMQFANALSNKDYNNLDGNIEVIESTLINLLSYMEDNPGWTTTGLYNGYVNEFIASTNVIQTAYNLYNGKVVEFNNTISTFPNVIFVGGRDKLETKTMPSSFNVTLPSFND